MTQSISDLVVKEISKPLVATCSLLANERIKFEYDRMGLSLNQRVLKISAGYVGEFLISDFLRVNEIPFVHYVIIGQYDKGNDFVVGNKIVDVKTTIINSNNQSVDTLKTLLFNKFHLYVAKDIGQSDGSNADYYIQVFVTSEWQYAFLCGYSHKDKLVPSTNVNNIFPALQVPIRDLSPLASIKFDLNFSPTCKLCGKLLNGSISSIERQIAQSLLKKSLVLCDDCC